MASLAIAFADEYDNWVLFELPLPLLLLLPELELPELELPLPEEDPPDELPDDDPLDELPEAPEPDPVEAELPEVVATELDPLFKLVVFPIPSLASSFAPILDKSENIGLSLFVIPYAATAAAIHNTIIIEMIIFALSNFFPPVNLI